MMNYLLVRHKIEDYGKWKPVFDAHSSSRTAGGLDGGWLMRNADDPLEIVVFFKVSDPARAREFVDSQDLKNAMRDAGVLDTPDTYFLDQIEEFAA